MVHLKLTLQGTETDTLSHARLIGTYSVRHYLDRQFLPAELAGDSAGTTPALTSVQKLQRVEIGVLDHKTKADHLSGEIL